MMKACCAYQGSCLSILVLRLLTMAFSTNTVALVALLGTLVSLETFAFSSRLFLVKRVSSQRTRAHVMLSASNNDNNVFNEDNLFNDNNDDDPKLGIDIGKMLEPLTPEQAEQLRAEASELISDKVAQGVDDIEALRKQLKKDVERASQERLLKSEKQAQKASDALLNKIDRMTNDFMSQSESMRKSTKLAAAADKASEGKSVELGSWGNIGGATVSTGVSSLLGSVASSVREESMSSATTTTSGAQESAAESEAATAVAPKENRILIIADPSQVRSYSIYYYGD